MKPFLFGCALLGLLLVPTILFGQTHPCDTTPPTTYQVRRDEAVKVGFCHNQQEDDGTPIALGQIRFRLVNAASGGVIADLGLLSPVTGPSATGQYYFESPSRTFPGDVNVTVSAEYAGQLAVAATPIFVDVRGGPKPPTNLRILP